MKANKSTTLASEILHKLKCKAKFCRNALAISLIVNIALIAALLYCR